MSPRKRVIKVTNDEETYRAEAATPDLTDEERATREYTTTELTTQETTGGMPQPYGAPVATTDAGYLDDEERAEDANLSETDLRVEDLLLEAVDSLNAMVIGPNSHHMTALDRIRRARNLLGGRDEDADESDEDVQARLTAQLDAQDRLERKQLRAEQKASRR